MSIDFFQWNAAGDEHFDAKRYEEALDCYTKALLNDPNREEGFAYLVCRKKAICLISLRRYDDALKDIEESIRLDPGGANGYALRGDAYRGLGKYPEAVADYNRAISLDGKVYVYTYRHERGGLYEFLGDFRKALKDYRYAVRDPMANAAVPDIPYRRHCDLAGVWLALGKYRRAIGTYTRALDFDPDGVEARYGRGLAYLKRGKTAEAESDLAAVAAAHPDLLFAAPAQREGRATGGAAVENPYAAVTEFRRRLEDRKAAEKAAEKAKDTPKKKVRVFLEKGNDELVPEDLPGPDDDLSTILSFARSYNGFEAKGSFEACGELANDSLAAYAKSGKLPTTIADLRACLFFEERRIQHAGEPDDEGVAYIYALLEAIREKVGRRGRDG